MAAQPDPKTISITLPAPVGGWNQLDAEDALDPTEALVLTNVYPDRAGNLRNGFATYGTGMGAGAVEAIAELALRTGSTYWQLVQCANNKIYQNTAAGAASDITAGSAITSNRWQLHQFAAAGNNYLVFLNGVDTPKKYEGSAVTDLAITGPTATTVIQGCGFKARQWVCCVNSQSIWYGPLNSVEGAFIEFDLGPQLTKGGSIQWVQSLTQGTGALQNNLLCIATDKGELLIYAGDYPGNIWSIIGRYYVGETLSRRSFINVPGDLLVIAEDGLWSISKFLSGEDIRAVSYPISKAWLTATATAGTNWGWSGFYYPSKKAVIINIPMVENSSIEQYAMNMSIQRQDGFHPWCRFTGANSPSWCMYNRKPFFGGLGGTSFQFDIGTDDNGMNIQVEIMTGYNYFGDRRTVKLFDSLKPITTVSSSVSLAVGVSCDFVKKVPASPINLTGGNFVPWGSPWGSKWSGGSLTSAKWAGVSGSGVCGAINISGSVKGTPLKISAIQVRYRAGGEL